MNLLNMLIKLIIYLQFLLNNGGLMPSGTDPDIRMFFTMNTCVLSGSHTLRERSL